jgi:hypothetical protein
VVALRLLRVDRQTFVRQYWDYNAGEHVALIQPTQGGKTHMAGDLLAELAGEIPATMLVMKPRDSTPAAVTRRLGYREVDTWPPPRPWPWEERPPGYTLWPKQSLTDIDADNAHLKKQFRKCLYDVYAHGDQIVLADEVYGLVAELGLATELTMLWTRGSGMGAGLWAATQKPSGTQHGGSIPTFMYNSSTHFFLGKDTNETNTKRLGEISGIDVRVVSDIVRTLPLHKITDDQGQPHFISEQLYIDKRGPYMALVGL